MAEPGRVQAECAAAARAGLYAGRELKQEPEITLETTGTPIKSEPTTVQEMITVELEPMPVEPELVTVKAEPLQYDEVYPASDTLETTETVIIKREPNVMQEPVTIKVEHISTEPELSFKEETTPCGSEVSDEDSFSDKSFEEPTIDQNRYNTINSSSKDSYNSFKCTITQKQSGIQHICDICKKVFNKKSFLVRHQRVHTQEKPYVCNVCSKQFSQRCSLTRHEQIHTGQKPHSCVICKKHFANSSYLKVHERCHTGEKPYSCGVCQKRFSVSSSFKRHARTHTQQCNNT